MFRNLLRLVNIGEFSPDAEWKDPSASYLLGQVSCPVCGLCVDVDLCRDAVLPDEDENVTKWLVLMI